MTAMAEQLEQQVARPWSERKQGFAGPEFVLRGLQAEGAKFVGRRFGHDGSGAAACPPGASPTDGRVAIP